METERQDPYPVGTTVFVKDTGNEVTIIGYFYRPDDMFYCARAVNSEVTVQNSYLQLRHTEVEPVRYPQV